MTIAIEPDVSVPAGRTARQGSGGSGHAGPPPKRYRVGELAEHFGLTRQTLHNYTRWGLIQAVAHTGGGHRLYDESVFERVSLILRWKADHTMEQIGRRLAQADDPAGQLGSPEAAQPTRQAG